MFKGRSVRHKNFLSRGCRRKKIFRHFSLHMSSYGTQTWKEYRSRAGLFLSQHWKVSYHWAKLYRWPLHWWASTSCWLPQRLVLSEQWTLDCRWCPTESRLSQESRLYRARLGFGRQIYHLGRQSYRPPTHYYDYSEVCIEMLSYCSCSNWGWRWERCWSQITIYLSDHQWCKLRSHWHWWLKITRDGGLSSLVSVLSGRLH